jgi:hypothetical protein
VLCVQQSWGNEYSLLAGSGSLSRMSGLTRVRHDGNGKSIAGWKVDANHQLGSVVRWTELEV